MHKQKYLFNSKLYLKFRLRLVGTDLNGLSLNAAYETKERAPRRFHCFAQYLQKRFPTRNLAYAQRRLLLSVSKGFRKLVRISFAVISILATCFAT